MAYYTECILLNKPSGEMDYNLKTKKKSWSEFIEKEWRVRKKPL